MDEFGEMEHAAASYASGRVRDSNPDAEPVWFKVAELQSLNRGNMNAMVPAGDPPADPVVWDRALNFGKWLDAQSKLPDNEKTQPVTAKMAKDYADTLADVMELRTNIEAIMSFFGS